MGRLSAALASLILFLSFGLTFAWAQDAVPKAAPPAGEEVQKGGNALDDDFEKAIEEAKAKGQPKAKADPTKTDPKAQPGEVGNVNGNEITDWFVVVPGSVPFLEIKNLERGVAITRYTLPNGRGFGVIGAPGMAIYPIPGLSSHVIIKMNGVGKRIGYQAFKPVTVQSPNPFRPLLVVKDIDKNDVTLNKPNAPLNIKGQGDSYEIPPPGNEGYRWLQAIYGAPQELAFSKTTAYWVEAGISPARLRVLAQELTGIKLPADAPPVFQRAATKGEQPKDAPAKGQPKAKAKAKGKRGRPAPKGAEVEQPNEVAAPQ